MNGVTKRAKVPLATAPRPVAAIALRLLLGFWIELRSDPQARSGTQSVYVRKETKKLLSQAAKKQRFVNYFALRLKNNWTRGRKW